MTGSVTMTSPTIQPEQRGAGPDQDRIAVEQRHDQSRPGHDQRNADGEADHEQRHIALGSRRDGDHVVEAHDDVGNGDDPHRPPQMLDRLDLVLVLVLRHQQLDRDIEQRQSAHDLEPRQQHQRSDDGGEDDAQDDGDARAQDHAPHPLAMAEARGRPSQ